MRKNPGNAAACRGRGSAYNKKGMSGQAVADYGAILRINPKDAAARQGGEWARRARAR
ncbi:MAG: hypothetical protein LBP74_02000 [Treponema sp.]|nr:hypothetical protein [Treponema sp.]